MLKLTALKKKNILLLIPLTICLVGAFTYYFSCIKLKPNDVIITTSDGTALFSNENPTFRVDFGSKENPQGQIVRFETKASNSNPFEVESKKGIFTKIVELFRPEKKLGIQMSLVGIDFSETGKTENTTLASNVQTVAEILGTDQVETSTNLVDMGREIGDLETEDIVSKPTIVNGNIANGIDLEYQILSGYGLKEEIVINDLEAYADSCGESCSLPLNEFEFDLVVDEGVVLKKGWFTVAGQSTEIYYFVDGDGNYLAHFLPSYAIDKVGEKTYEVDLDIQEYSVGKFKAVVTVDSSWLLDSNRVYPIRIDPSIVHDDTSDFSGGVFVRSEAIAGPKIQAKVGLNCTGGTQYIFQGYMVHAFNSTSTLSCVGSGYGDVLVVAGGGGAGNAGGGGGGAGGVVLSTNFSISSGNTSVTVGNGGAAHTNGGNSVFSSITAVGGGRGGTYSGAGTRENGASGGSGGGGSLSYPDTPGTGGSGTAGQGNNGGTGGVGTGPSAAGGGGARAVGGNGNSSGVGGAGGVGIDYSSYFGTGVGQSGYFGGGGGGGNWSGSYAGGTGGTGGGGSGVNNSGTGGAGTANTGGGGGGAGSGGTGGAGGSGIVLVRYQLYGASPYSGYISSTLDLGGTKTGGTFSWVSTGIATGNGETPYSTTGLIAQWNFNETSGTTAVSGGTCSTSCNGTLTNMTTTGQDAAVLSGWTANNRRWGAGALMFDGSNDYVSVTHNSNMNPAGNTFTFEAWFNKIGNQDNYILYKGATAPSFALGVDDRAGYDSFDISFWDTTGTRQRPSVINDGDIRFADGWHYVVGVLDGSMMYEYVDGKLVASSAFSGTFRTNTENLSVGTYNMSTGTYNFSGVLDSVRLYTRALSADEILSNYQSGNIEFQYRVSTDNSTWSSWSSDGVGTSDSSWRTFDNTYLYDTDASGLVAYWSLNETSGTSLADSVGSNTGTATGTSVVAGKHSNARSFNGSSDYIRGVVSNYQSSDTLGTIEAWIMINNTTNSQTIFQSSDEATDSYWLQFRVNATTGTLSMLQKNNDTYDQISGNTVLSPSNWYHVAVVSSGSAYSLYVNGRSETLTVGSGSNSGDWFADTPNRDNFMIGMNKRSTSSDYLNGNIDEVRIFNTALTATQIQANYIQGLNTLGVYQQRTGDIETEGAGSTRITHSLGDGLVSHWKFDEGSGASLSDSIGSNPATATGTSIVNGKYGNARNFNGTSSDYIEIPDNSSLDLTNNFTLETWIYRSIDSGGFERLISKSGTDGYDYWMQIKNTDVVECGITSSAGASYYTNTTATIPTGSWSHITCVLTSGNAWSVYINGVSVSTSNTGTAAAARTSSRNLQIGRLGTGSTWYYSFYGIIDEVKVYNSAKTADEILEEYNATNTYYVNQSLVVKDLSSHNTLSIDIAGDRVGSYITASWGESAFVNYQPDGNTVGLWHLDEISGSGAYIKDASGRNNSATPTGSTLVTGVSGNGRNFNSTSDILQISDSDTLSFTTNMTAEGWFKTSSSATNQMIVNKQLGGTYYPEYILYVNAGSVMGYINSANSATNAKTVTSPSAIYADGQWHYAAMTYDGSSLKLYVDGIHVATTAASITLWNSTSAVGIGRDPGTNTTRFVGSLDEIRLSNIARTADEIRQVYELGSRTHNVFVDFGATLNSGNLITGSGDTSFTIDATTQGLPQMGSNLYLDEKIVVREVSGGVEYLAQGNVASITLATGVATVSAWDNGSTFPTGGFTTKASVFKWQTEYIPIKNRTIGTHVDSTSLLTIKFAGAFGGRNMWVDNLRSSDGYLATAAGETISFPYGARYFQYKMIITSQGSQTTPYVSQVQLDYATGGPTIDQIMRHGKWFDSGTKKNFWWSNGSQ